MPEGLSCIDRIPFPHPKDQLYNQEAGGRKKSFYSSNSPSGQNVLRQLLDALSDQSDQGRVVILDGRIIDRGLADTEDLP